MVMGMEDTMVGLGTDTLCVCERDLKINDCIPMVSEGNFREDIATPKSCSFFQLPIIIMHAKSWSIIILYHGTTFQLISTPLSALTTGKTLTAHR